MRIQEYMQRHMRELAGGIAWSFHVLGPGQRYPSGQLVDAAVDIAWARLLLRAARPQELVIERRFNMLLFRAKPCLDAERGARIT